MIPITSHAFRRYNYLKQHCVSRISASIWLRFKMDTTTHLSDATHFLMRPQNVVTYLFACFVVWYYFSYKFSKLPILFLSCIFFHLFPLTCQNLMHPSCPEHVICINTHHYLPPFPLPTPSK